MHHFILWTSVHREMLLGFIAVSVWVLANYWYLRGDIRRMRRDNRPRTWSVDMAARTTKGGRKNIR